MQTIMKTLLARLIARVKEGNRFEANRQGRTRKLVGEEEMLIAKGREQFQRLLEKGLSIPIATL